VPKWIFLCAVVGAVGVAGCAESRQYFRPTEHVYGETLRGDREAIYNLVGPRGPFGEAKVWSHGAFREEGATVLHATIDIHNTSGAEIVVDPQRIRLEPVRVGADLLHDFAPVERQALSIAPGAFGSVRLRFVLPASIHPAQVSSFGLHWQVDNGPQKYTQTTPFLEESGHYGYYGYPAAYGVAYGYGCSWADPFCRPYGFGSYGFGYGYGYGGGGYGVRGGAVISAPPARPARTVIHRR
jgi:hypothetical protein